MPPLQLTLKSETSKIDKYVARLLLLSFFLPMQLQPIAAVACCVYFIIQSFRAGERLSFARLLTGISLGALYLLYVFALPLTQPKFAPIVQQLLEYRLAFLLFPLLFALVQPKLLNLILGELAWFVVGCILVCLATDIAFALAYLTKAPFFIQFSMPAGGYISLSHVHYRVFFEKFNGYHPTYMSMMLAFSVSALLTGAAKLNRMAKYAAFYLLIFLLLGLLAKSPIIGLALVCCHVAWLRRKTLLQYKWMLLGTLAVLILSYAFVPVVSQRVNELFASTSASKNGYVENNSVYERKMIFSTDMSMLKHYWLSGCGPGRLMTLLKMRYMFFSLEYCRNVGAFDPHNEYLFQWISFGLMGIVFFLATLVAHFWQALRTRFYLYTYWLLIVCITFFTESVLTTQHGIIFFSVFASVFFFSTRAKQIEA